MARCQSSVDFLWKVAEAGYCEGDPRIYYNALAKIINDYGLRRFDLTFV